MEETESAPQARKSTKAQQLTTMRKNNMDSLDKQVTRQVATGCVNIQGTINGITYTPTTTKKFPIKGTTETDVYVGGCTNDGKTVNYQGGGANGWSNFVHIPAGEEIIINVLDYGNVENFARIEVLTCQ